ncbi:copper resistance protein CopC [Sphingosinicellaceae bacterium]|nr:copper resistance protein CopC [Sphingosinicellaceae bacterium]
MRVQSRLVAALVAVGLWASAPALAGSTLVSAVPPAGATAANVRSLTLNFSDRVIDTVSGVEMVMTAMPGMASHQPMKIAGFKTALSADGKALAIALPRALPAGTYKVTWHAVSSDNQSAEGSYSFSAK